MILFFSLFDQYSSIIQLQVLSKMLQLNGCIYFNMVWIYHITLIAVIGHIDCDRLILIIDFSRKNKDITVWRIIIIY